MTYYDRFNSIGLTSIDRNKIIHLSQYKDDEFKWDYLR